MLHLRLASLSPPHPGARFVSWWNMYPIKACLIILSMQTRECFGTFWPQFFPLSTSSFWQDTRFVSSRTAVTNTCAVAAHWLCNKWWKFLQHQFLPVLNYYIWCLQTGQPWNSLTYLWMSWVPRSCCTCSVTFLLMMSHSFPTVFTTTVGGAELSVEKQTPHDSFNSNGREVF